MDFVKLRPLLFQLPLTPISLILLGMFFAAFRGVGAFIGVILVLIGVLLAARWLRANGASWLRHLSWMKDNLDARELACRDRLHTNLRPFLIARGAIKPLNQDSTDSQGRIASLLDSVAELLRTDVPRIARWRSEPRGPVAIVSLPVGMTFEWFEREHWGLADAWGVQSVSVQRTVPGYVLLVGVIRDPLEGSRFRGEAEALSDPHLSADDFLDGRDA